MGQRLMAWLSTAVQIDGKDDKFCPALHASKVSRYKSTKHNILDIRMTKLQYC